MKKMLVLLGIIAMMLSTILFAEAGEYADKSDFEFLGSRITKYKGSAEVVKVPASFNVTEIGQGAFSSNTTIKELDLSECTSLTTIFGADIGTSYGNLGAFNGCTNLEKVTLPVSLLKLSKRSFYNCTKLTTINLSDLTLLTTLESEVFSGTALTSFDLSNLTQLKNVTDSFKGASLVTSINLSGCSAITAVGSFSSLKNLQSIDLSGTTALTEIERDAFNGCNSLASIKLDHSGIQSIGTSAFLNATALTEIDLSECNSLKTIHNASVEGGFVQDTGVFQGCTSLETVKLPASLETIGSKAFSDCIKLKDVNFNELDGLVTLVGYAFAETALETVDLSNKQALQTIDKFAFDKCNQLTQVKLSGNRVLVDIDGAFSTCAELVSLDLSDCTSLKTIGLFSALTKLETVNLSNCAALELIASGAFADCTSLVNVDLSGCMALTLVYKKAFLKTALETIDLSNTGLINIVDASMYGQAYQSDGAFQFCTKLKNIILPASIKTIGNNAFADCTALEKIDFSGKTSLQEVRGLAFSECTALTEVNLSGCTALKTVDGAFDGCTNLTKLNLSDCTVLNDTGTFQNLKMLEIVNLSNSNLSELENQLFSDCTSLTEVILDGCTNLKKISYGALNGTALAEIDLSGCTGLTEISSASRPYQTYQDNGVFQNCKLLTSIILPNSLTTIGAKAFAGCILLEEINFAGNTGLKTIMYSAFEGCTALKSINLSNCTSLLTIEEKAFDKCTELESINFSGSGLSDIGKYPNLTKLECVDLSNCTALTKIQQQAFSGCTSLKNVVLAGCTKLTSIESSAFSGSVITEVDFSGMTAIETFYWSALNGATELEKIDLSGCTKLTSFRDSVSSLTKLKSIDLSGCVKFNSGLDILKGHKGIESIDLSGCTGLTSIPSKTFQSCSNLKDVDLTGCTGLNSILSNAFQATNLSIIDLSDCTNLTTIIGGTASSYSGSFYDCKQLETVVLPRKTADNIVTLDQGAYPFGATHNVKAIYVHSDEQLTEYKKDANWQSLITYSKLPDIIQYPFATYKAVTVPEYNNGSLSIRTLNDSTADFAGAMLLVAFYDKDGQVVEVMQSDLSGDNHSFEKPENAENAKIITLQSWDQIKPLAKYTAVNLAPTEN